MVKASGLTVNTALEFLTAPEEKEVKRVEKLVAVPPKVKEEKKPQAIVEDLVVVEDPVIEEGETKRKFFLVLYYDDGRKEEIPVTEKIGEWLQYTI